MAEATAKQSALPRSPWQSQVTYLRLMFKAKKALDRIEQKNQIHTENLIYPRGEKLPASPLPAIDSSSND
jgi:hypothetical protein